MVTIDYHITGKTEKEAKKNTEAIHDKLHAYYKHDAKGDDDTFLAQMGRYKLLITMALALPPGTIKKLRASKDHTW